MKKILTIALILGISLQTIPAYSWEWDPLGAKKAAENLGKESIKESGILVEKIIEALKTTQQTIESTSHNAITRVGAISQHALDASLNIKNGLTDAGSIAAHTLGTSITQTGNNIEQASVNLVKTAQELTKTAEKMKSITVDIPDVSALGKSLDNLQNIKVTVEHSFPLRTIKVAAVVGLGITLSASGIYLLLQKKEPVKELPEDLSDDEYVYARCTQLLKKAAPYLTSAACLTAGLALIIYSEKLAS